MHPSTLYHWLARLRWPLMLILLLLGLVLSLPTGVTRVVAVTGIAASSSDRQIVLISTGQVEQLPDRVLLGKLPAVRQAILSANGAWAAIDPDRPFSNQPSAPTIQILPTAGAASVRKVVLPHVANQFIALSNDGRWLLTCDPSVSCEKTLIVDTEHGITQELLPRSDGGHVQEMYFAPDSTALLIILTRTIQVFATDTWQQYIVIPTNHSGAPSAYAPHHQLLALRGRRGITLHPLAIQQPPTTLPNPLGNDDIEGLAFSPDEHYLLVAANYSAPPDPLLSLPISGHRWRSSASRMGRSCSVFKVL